MTFERKYVVIFILLLLNISILSSCNRKEKKVDRLQKFKAELWKGDKNGCNGDRLGLKDDLLALKHNMRGLKSNEIENFLGKPDAQELYERSQRYFIYFLEPGPKCDTTTKNPLALFVRFSAMGIANEFSIKPL